VELKRPAEALPAAADLAIAAEQEIPAPTAEDIDPEVALALGVTVIDAAAPWYETLPTAAPSVEAVSEPATAPPPPFDIPPLSSAMAAPTAEAAASEVELTASPAELQAALAPVAVPPAETTEPADVTVTHAEPGLMLWGAPAPSVADKAELDELIHRPPVVPVWTSTRPRMDNRLKFDLAVAAIVVLVASGFGISRMFQPGPTPPKPVILGSPYAGTLQGVNYADGGPPTPVSVTYDVSTGSGSGGNLSVTASGTDLSMMSTYIISGSGVRLTETSTGTALGMIVVTCTNPILMDPSPITNGATFQIHSTCSGSAPDGSTFSRTYQGSGTVTAIGHSRLNGVSVATATLRYSLDYSESFGGQAPIKGNQAEIDVIQINPFVVLSAATTSTLNAPSGPQTRSTIFWIQGFQASQ
jgi:hypothetical protein